MQRLTEYLDWYAKLPPRERSSERSRFRHLAADMVERIEMLEQALVRFGDRGRMATTEPPALQYVIDLAFSNEAGRT